MDRASRPPAPVAGALSPASRAAALERLGRGEPVDVLVVGGGVVGVSCALDAAARGLSVVLVERDDLASGTSSRSSKLIHGGLRYLEQLDVGLVFEALRERTLQLRELAPHLVHPVPFVLPLERPLRQRPYYGAGVALYDLLAAGRHNPLPRHRHLDAADIAQRLPGVRRDVVRGGIAFWDAQLDDARHTVTVARTAARHGAHVATYAELRAVGEPDRDGCRPVVVHDRDTGRRIDGRARVVLNATGVWSETTESLVGPPTLRVRASKGVHLVVPRDRIDAEAGLIVPTEKSVLFVIPWLGRWLLGTTDTDWHEDRATPVAHRGDVAYVLDHANAVLRRPLSADDVTAVFAGLRPLVARDDAVDTTQLSREHEVHRPGAGLVAVTGGKYTTARLMAVDAVDAVADELGRSVRSATAHLALLGAGPHDDAAEHLRARYGAEAGALEAMAETEPHLRVHVSRDPEHLAVEVAFAVRAEGARHLRDVMERRTRLTLLAADRGRAVARDVARLMAAELGWDEATTGREVDAVRLVLDAEAAALEADDDADAVARYRAVLDGRMLHTGPLR